VPLRLARILHCGFVQLPTGVQVVTTTSALAAVCGPALLVHSARRYPGLRRQAHALLATGAAVVATGTVAGAVTLATHADAWGVSVGPWVSYAAQREGPATLVALTTTLGAVLLCAGLLRLPGAAGGAGTAIRLILDGLVISSALWLVGWVLVAEPTRLLGTATPPEDPTLVAATVAAALAAGLPPIVGARSRGTRRALFLVGCGISLAVSGGLVSAVGLFRAGAGVALAGLLLVPAGLLIVAMAARSGEFAKPADSEVERRGTGYAFLPMLTLALAVFYHLARSGSFTVYGVVAGLTEGFALVARQHLALGDVRRYAQRLAEREAHFRELAHTDPLTGLANRRGLLAVLHRDPPGVPRVLLGLDLDGFKGVNDMRGHDVGDEVLSEVGQRLRSNLRAGDLAARLGGDEFAVLMWARLPEAQRVADRLLGVLSQPYGPAGDIFLSVSIGMADHTGAADVPALLRNADLALRYAKQRGKNRVERYDVGYDRLSRRRTMLEHEMRGAIDRGELNLVFQPIVAVRSGRPVGAEALLRWQHPELGLVRPDEFIPLAEECGMSARFGEWVLHRACHQLSLWLTAGYDVWLSVNVSPRELHTPEYLRRVTEALRVHRVPEGRLVLEVTERLVATDQDELTGRLTALRGTGVRIALDGFGAGYFSLGRLHRLPIDILKIDHSLITVPGSVTPADPEPERVPGRMVAPLVDVVMRLGEQLGLEVIAEGVTNATELTAVIDAGCRLGQGQLFGWGVLAEQLEAMLAAQGDAVEPPLPASRAPRAQDMGSVDSGHEMRQS
jgi:diguanylate cyclase (GGDEF)-like protein